MTERGADHQYRYHFVFVLGPKCLSLNVDIVVIIKKARNLTVYLALPFRQSLCYNTRHKIRWPLPIGTLRNISAACASRQNLYAIDRSSDYWFTAQVCACLGKMVSSKRPIKWRQRPDMTIAVDYDVKHLFKQKSHNVRFNELAHYVINIFVYP